MQEVALTVVSYRATCPHCGETFLVSHRSWVVNCPLGHSFEGNLVPHGYRWTCPDCGAVLFTDKGDKGNPLRCPWCGGQFLAGEIAHQPMRLV